MSDNDTKKSDENNGPLAGDALLQAVRQDLRELFGALDQKVLGLDARVHGLDQKVEGLDARVDARLRDTTPMWEVVVSRLDVIIAGQESNASRLDTIDARLEGIESEQRKQGARLEAIESEQRKQGARLDAIESRLDAIEIKLERFDAIDRELRHLGRRIERTIAELSGDFVKFRVDQHDLEDRLEKLEKTPA